MGNLYGAGSVGEQNEYERRIAMSTLEDVIAQFRHKTADEIATMVRKRGIKGRMGTTYGCPMALLLDGSFTGEYVIGRKYIVRRSGAKMQKARTPRQVAIFVRKFDLGGYPDIVAPPPRCTNGQKKRHGASGHTGRTRPPIKNHISKLVGRFDAA